MNLSKFPRPHKDNGRGVHWSMSTYWASQGKQKWDFWADQVKAMNIKWAKVMDDGGGSSLKLVNRLVDLGIMPVVRLYWPEQNSAEHTSGIIGSRGAEAVALLLDAGAVYFEVNNEPDLDLEWVNRRKPENWLDIVVNNFIADADIILDLGGYPATPAFGMGSQDNLFEKVIDKGRADLFNDGCWAGIHNYCLGRPLEYPNDPVNLYGQPLLPGEYEEAGGFPVWEISEAKVNEAREKYKNPDATIMNDSTCFRGFEQLDEYIRQAVGHSIPIMMTEGGYNVGQRAGTYEGDDPRYPKPTPQKTSELTHDMFEYMQGSRTILGKTVPEYFFAAMPWLIANYEMHVYQPPAESQGPWFTNLFNVEYNLNGELPLVQMLKDMPTITRVDGPTPDGWDTIRNSDMLGDAWDDRLDYIDVWYFPGDGGEFKLAEAVWKDEEESGGACAIFVRILDENGNPMPNHEFHVLREDADDLVHTKDWQDNYWGNYTMYGGLGTYTVCVNEGSDSIIGLGYGVETPPHAPAPTSFFLTFQKVDKTTQELPEIELNKIKQDISNIKSILIGANKWTL